MAYSEAQKRATIKNLKKNYEEMRFRVRKGEKKKIHDFAEAQGKSFSQWIKELIENEMKKDGQ